jgi:GDP-L-fucose synthase
MPASEKIAILGGTGFLGQHVAAAFEKKASAVEACSRSTGVDAREDGALARFLERSGASILINCAHHGGGIGYNAAHPLEILEDNLRIGFHAVQAAAAARVRKFVNILGNSSYPGSAALYRESAWWDGPLDPSVLASALPRKAEWAHAQAYRQEAGLASIHLVLPNLYGPGDHLEPERSHALMALVRKVVEAKRAGRGRVEIWGTGAPVREWLYAPDAAEGIVRATETYDGAGILNLGRGEGCSVRELAETIRELAGWDGEFFYDTLRPDGAPRKIFDVSRMEALVGWKPPTTLREGIRRTIEWFVRAECAAAASR